MMGYDIRQVSGQSDYEAVTTLRYAVYAAEEGLDIPGMDHRRRTLSDPTDAEAIVLGVFDGGRAIATMSVTPMRALGSAADVRHFFGSAAFPVDESRQALIGRLMVQSGYRGSPVCLQLFKAAYRHLLRAGFAVGFVESNPRTIPLYESIGCRRYGKACGHPAYGLLAPMAIIADVHYLERIRSPLRSLTPVSAQHAELGRWFEDTHARGAAFASVRAMSRDSFDEAMGALCAARAARCSDCLPESFKSCYVSVRCWTSRRPRPYCRVAARGPRCIWSPPARSRSSDRTPVGARCG